MWKGEHFGTLPGPARVILGLLRIGPSTIRPPTDKLIECCQETIGALDVGHVAAARDHGERTFPEADDRLPGLTLREHPVALSPHDKPRNLQEGEAVQQHLALTEGAHQGA